MLLKVYSDASTENDSVVVSLILSEDDNFIDLIMKKYDTVNSYIAELLGVIQSLEYIINTGIPVSEIHCYTDNKSIVNLFYENKKYNRKFPEEKRFKDLCEESGYSRIRIHYVKGHQHQLNPNSICDLLAGSIRRGKVPI